MTVHFSCHCMVAGLTGLTSCTGFGYMHSRYTLNIRPCVLLLLFSWKFPLFPLHPVPSRPLRSSTPPGSFIWPIHCTCFFAGCDALFSVRFNKISVHSRHGRWNLPRTSLPVVFASRECFNVTNPCDCLYVPAVAVIGAPCGCWACCCICTCCSRIASISCTCWSRVCCITISICVASMASYDCRCGLLRNHVMFLFFEPRYLRVQHVAIAVGHQVHCHKENCFVHLGMWEVYSVCTRWSADALCQQPWAFNKKTSWIDRHCTQVAVFWSSTNASQCLWKHWCAQWSRFLLHVLVSTSILRDWKEDKMQPVRCRLFSGTSCGLFCKCCNRRTIGVHAKCIYKINEEVELDV